MLFFVVVIAGIFWGKKEKLLYQCNGLPHWKFLKSIRYRGSEDLRTWQRQSKGEISFTDDWNSSYYVRDNLSNGEYSQRAAATYTKALLSLFPKLRSDLLFHCKWKSYASSCLKYCHVWSYIEKRKEFCMSLMDQNLLIRPSYQIVLLDVHWSALEESSFSQNEIISLSCFKQRLHKLKQISDSSSTSFILLIAN